MECYDEEENKYFWIDTEDGAKVKKSSIERFAYRFLRQPSALPSSPRLWPSIIAECETDLLAGSASGRLGPAPDDAMTDPAFVLMLRGVILEEEFYWKLCYGYFITRSGEIFADRKEIPKGRKRHFLALFKDGDSVPSVALPEGKYLSALQRFGCKLEFEGERVRVASKEWTPPDIELWDYSKKIDALDEELRAAARRSSSASN